MVAAVSRQAVLCMSPQIGKGRLKTGNMFSDGLLMNGI